MKLDDPRISELMALLGRRRWQGKSAEERRAHSLRMVAARLKKRKEKAKALPVVKRRISGETSG